MAIRSPIVDLGSRIGGLPSGDRLDCALSFPWISGRRYLGIATTSNSSSAITLAADTLKAWAVVITSPVTIAALCTYVASAATGNVRVGLYADNGSGYPGTLIEDCGEISTSTTGIKRYPFASAVTLQPGLYWLAMNASTSTAQLRMHSGGTIFNVLGVDLATGAAYSIISVSLTYAALPSTFTAGAVAGTSQQAITVEAN